MGKQEILHASFFTPMPGGRWGSPLILWGEPGTAKTALIELLARLYGMPCEALQPGAKGEGAFGVTPCPSETSDGKGGRRMVIGYPPPEWTAGFTEETGGVIFFDELTTAPPAIQPVLLGGVQNREIGGWKAPLRTRVYGAANYVGQQTAGGGWPIPGSVANRCGHIDWPGPDCDQWATFLLGGAGSESESRRDPVLEEQMVLSMWPGEWALAAGQGTAFLRRRPELLHKRPTDDDPQLGRAWPSRRSWEYALRALSAARIHKLSREDTEEYVAAFVGTAAATECFNWLDEQDLPDIAALLDGQVKWVADYDRLDRTEAVLSACSAMVAPIGAAMRDQRMARLWELLQDVTDMAKDIALPAVTVLCGAKAKDGRPLRHDGPAATKVLARLHLMANSTGF